MQIIHRQTILFKLLIGHNKFNKDCKYQTLEKWATRLIFPQCEQMHQPVPMVVWNGRLIHLIQQEQLVHLRQLRVNILPVAAALSSDEELESVSVSRTVPPMSLNASWASGGTVLTLQWEGETLSPYPYFVQGGVPPFLFLREYDAEKIFNAGGWVHFFHLSGSSSQNFHG